MTTHTVTLALEGSAEVEVVAIDHEEVRSSLLVSVRMPLMVDAEAANLAAALLIEQELDLKPDRIKVVNLKFRDRDAVTSLSEFLSQFSSSMTQLSLKDLHTDDNRIDEESFQVIVSSLLPKSSKLEVLNLSQNTLPPTIWQYVANCKSLRKLLLDHVFMETKSMREFTVHVPTSALEDFYLVLVRSQGDGESAMDACDFVSKCTNLLSLRWAHLQPPGSLPWAGLRMLSTQSFRLRHLILDGSMISVSELGNDGLCGTLRQLLQLRTLKLRDIGLRDNGVKGVVAALKIARPPLEWLELNGNQIENANCIAELAQVDKIISVLEVVALERNSISSDSALVLMEAFGPIHDIDLRLDSNPIDFKQVALDILRMDSNASDAQRKIQEYEANIQTLSAENAAMNDEILKLQSECKNLRMDRSTMIDAFSIVGASRQVEENRRMMDRIARLEERLGLSRDGYDRNGSFRVPPRTRSSFEPSTPQSESVSVSASNSRGLVLSAGAGGSRRQLITRDDQSQVTSRSGPSSNGRQLSPAAAFTSPGASSTTAVKQGVFRASSYRGPKPELMIAVDNSDNSSTPPGKPVFVRSISRKSLMGNDLESVPDVETPSGQRHVLARAQSTRLQNSMDLEKHGSSYQGAPGAAQREPTRSIRRYASDRSGRSGMDRSPPNSTSRVPRAVVVGEVDSEAESTIYQESFHH